MPYKTCPSCRQISYSAADNSIWFCPCCGEDISATAGIKDGRQVMGLHKRKAQKIYELRRKRTV